MIAGSGPAASGFANISSLPAYEQVNLGISQHFEEAPGGPIEIRLDVINLLDRSTRSAAAPGSASARRNSVRGAPCSPGSRRNSERMDTQSVTAAFEVGGVMIYPLLGLTVLAAVIILEKAYRPRRADAPVGAISSTLIETYGFAWSDVEAHVFGLSEANYFAGFFQVILANRTHPPWWVESRAADEASLIEKSLGRWLWVLETIVTAAPLLGLLGTITGMVRAFKLFGEGGLVDPSGVTGGVAEALIATALGLFIALVALFAFNFFSHRQAAGDGRDGAARHAARRSAPSRCGGGAG